MRRPEAHCREVRQQLAADLKACEPLISSPQERQGCKAYQRDWQACMAAQAELLPLSRGGQMDQATQQNTALVEESAAAAQSLKDQSQQLVQAAAVFRLAAA